MIVKGIFDQKVVVEKEVHSVGGGRIVFAGEEDHEPMIYPHHTFKAIKKIL